MNRREAIKQTTLWTGAGLLVPGIFAALQSCANRDKELDWQPIALSGEEVKRLEALSDTLLPETESPSASQVRVAEFIDLIIAEVLTVEQGDSIVHVLDQLESMSVSGENNTFIDLPQVDRTELVRNLDTAAYNEDVAEDWDSTLLADYRYLKSLILMAYYTSEDGVKQNLDYVVIPGDFQACIDMPEDGKIMVGNHM